MGDKRDTLIKWCDVERVIHNSLIDDTGNRPYWGLVLIDILYYLDGVRISYEGSNEVEYFSMVYYLIGKGWSSICKDDSQFYSKLLEELRVFERNYGRYVLSETSSEKYREQAKEYAERLTGSNRYIVVDSFNYSGFENSNITIRHINGDCDDPIFGVDVTEPEEKRYPYARWFTKTSRRIQQDSEKLNRTTRWNKMSIDEAVVFGHSLNRMDYDYFNYLFTLLRFHTFDVEKMGSIEFVYRVYDEKRENEIKANYVDAIYKLLNYYEGYVSHNNQHILINLLRFSGKLKIKDILDY